MLAMTVKAGDVFTIGDCRVTFHGRVGADGAVAYSLGDVRRVDELGQAIPVSPTATMTFYEHSWHNLRAVRVAIDAPRSIPVKREDGKVTK